MFYVHPGIPMEDRGVPSKGVASLTFVFSSFMQQAAVLPSQEMKVYILDVEEGRDPEHIMFGGARIRDTSQEEDAEDDITIDILDIPRDQHSNLLGTLRQELDQDSSWTYEARIRIAQQEWIVIMAAPKGAHTTRRDWIFCVVATAVLLVASVCVALWLRAVRRQQLAALHHAAETEKAALMLQNAKQAAQAASDLNDYLAHEVSAKDPLAWVLGCFHTYLL